MTNTYATKDFYLASFILAKGNPLKNHFRENGITTFHFDSSDNVQKAVAEYFTMSALIEPISYSNSIKGLKTVVHSDNTNENAKDNNYNVKQYRSSK